MAIIVVVRIDAQQVASDSIPAYKLMRQDEDWSSLRDSPLRRQPLYRIKYLGLRADTSWFLTLGGEVRPYYERFLHEHFAPTSPTPGGYLLQRYMPHADAHLGERVRVFLQPKSGLEHGRVGGPAPTMEDKLDVNQSFIDVRVSGGRAGSTAAGTQVRIGRHEMRYGSGRMVEVRDGANVRFGYDGVRADWWSPNGSTVSMFAVKPNATNIGVFDDGWLPGRTFWGVYATRLNRNAGSAHVDLYYLGATRDSVTYFRGAGNETRHTLGARVWWRTGGWNADIESAWQFGRFASDQLRAWMIAATPSYTFRETRWSPALLLNLAISSGDKNPQSGTLGTFSPPEPRGQYFARINALGPLNIMAVGPTVSVDPVSAMTLTANLYMFWRATANDGVYRLPGVLIRPSAPGRSRFLGNQIQVEANVRIGPNVVVTLNPAWFLTGQSLHGPPRGYDITYDAALITFKF